jgi:hypothetical protein
VDTPVTVAAPAGAARLLGGAPRLVRVVALTTTAAYLATGDPAVPALCLGTREAVRLPCSLVFSAAGPDGPFAGWRVGQTGVAGDGGVRVGGRWWRVARWWRPARSGPIDAAPGALSAAAAALARLPDPLDADAGMAAERLVAALRAGADPRPAVHGLLGRGPGLTPLGDDVLAGALVTVRTFAGGSAAPLTAAVAVAAPTRTTLVSAALLAHAARGECVTALAGLLGAVAQGAAGADLARAAAAVTAIGHTSGAGLVRGVLAGLAVAAPRTAAA